MNGLAEQNADGLARHLKDSLTIGKIYTLDQMSDLIGWQHQASKGKGVLSPSKSDAQILLMHLEKDSQSTKEYSDHLYGTTLFWSGQNSIKSTERALRDGTKDTFVFIQERRKAPYFYYGRAIPLRMQLVWEPGTPSHIVFDLPEYAAYLQRTDEMDTSMEHSYSTLFKEPDYDYGRTPLYVPESTETQVFAKIRTAQTQYRNSVIDFWDHKCAVTGVDDVSWLIASHIKPWRESTDSQRVDPHNSLLLTPNYDKLFDRGVISFSPVDGSIILPENQSRQMWNNFNKLHINDEQKLRHIDDRVGEYLEYHNHYIYQFEPHNASAIDDYLESIVAKSFA